jgi:hypothetical protein
LERATSAGPDSVEKHMLNERLRRGGRKQRLGLEAPNYLVVGIRESVLEETTVTPLRPGLIDALILAGLALRPPEPLSSHATRLGNDTLQPGIHPAPDVSVFRTTPQSFWW